MNDDLVNFPAARSWRDIPQPVKPRAMSRGGRWRLTMGVVRTTALGMLLGGIAWGGWQLFSALRGDVRAMPAAAKNVPIKPPELVTSTGGVLDAAWLERTLALPKNVSLMELDLDKLSAVVLRDGQVVSASFKLTFPDRLTVTISERSPVARIRVLFGETPRELLVAPDGVVYAGSCYDRATLDALPWLAGFALARDGAWFRPIPGMDVVSELLAKARAEAPHLYPSWHSIAMDRLELDRELKVVLKNGSTVTFDARGNFFKQLSWLDSIVERLETMPPSRADIDLSLGREVPVTLTPLLKPQVPATASSTRSRPPAPPAFPSINIFQATSSREL